MNGDECRSELVLAERQGKLTSVSRLALENHLATCETCRLLRTLGRDFDEPEDVRSDDARRLDSMLLAAEKWLNQPRSLTKLHTPKRRGKVVFLAAAIVVTAGAAAAATLVFQVSSLRKRPTLEATTTSTVSFEGRAAPESRVLPTVPSVATKALSESRNIAAQQPVAGDTSKGTAKHTRAIETTIEPESPAEQLLQQATIARRTGNAAQASRLFRKLQQLYPSTREARLSLVAFGSLLLDQGQATLALDQFTRYLTSPSGQNLAAEALFGKGRALSQLGRNAEARANWNQLLERFPKSPYASFARRQLEQSN